MGSAKSICCALVYYLCGKEREPMVGHSGYYLALNIKLIIGMGIKKSQSRKLRWMCKEERKPR